VTLTLATPAGSCSSELEWLSALDRFAALSYVDGTRYGIRAGPCRSSLGYTHCPVRGCENVAYYTATSLCQRCRRRFGKWRVKRDGAGLDEFLAEVTETRSEDVERMCLVCRTPGHERAFELAPSVLRVFLLPAAKRQSQSTMAYVLGDERYPPALPRLTFGR